MVLSGASRPVCPNFTLAGAERRSAVDRVSLHGILLGWIYCAADTVHRASVVWTMDAPYAIQLDAFVLPTS